MVAVSLKKKKKKIKNRQSNCTQIEEIREEYEDLSIKELGEMLDKPLGKSGVNHRLKKIEDIANELKEGRK